MQEYCSKQTKRPAVMMCKTDQCHTDACRRGFRLPRQHVRKLTSNVAVMESVKLLVFVLMITFPCLFPHIWLLQFYRALNIRVALVGLEVWSDSDKCPITQDPFATLHEFLDWRKVKLLPQKAHDNAQLIR